jgi:hypothetical protein
MIFSETLAPKRVQKFSITFEHEVKNWKIVKCLKLFFSRTKSYRDEQIVAT